MSPTVRTVLAAIASLELPDCWLAAGAVAQTVWNVQAGRDPDADVLDYDVVYCDPADLSAAAQQAATDRVRAALPGIAVDVVNEARVHLWYADVFGVPCPAFSAVEDALRGFLTTASALAVRTGTAGPELLAPFGVADTLAGIVRPNPARPLPAAYAAKAERWARTWPALTVLPWPEPAVE